MSASSSSQEFAMQRLFLLTQSSTRKRARWMRSSTRIARDLEDLAACAFDSHRGELAAPDTARIEAEQVGPIDKTERRPVAECDRHSRGSPPWRIEPGEETGRRRVGAVFGGELEHAVGGDETDPRQGGEREAQPLVTGQRFAPARRLVAEHGAEKLAQRRFAQAAFELAGERQRLRQIPLRHDAGM